jgi:hypothetical protein
MSKFFLGKLFSKAPKTTGTGAINTTNISKNLKEFKKHKEDIIKTTDKHSKGLTTEGKIEVKKTVSPALSKVSGILKKYEKKAKGGRVGLKFGGGADMGKKKSNIQKIKEAFGTKSKNKNLKPVNKKKNPGLAKLPIEVRNKMGYAKKGGRA